MTTKDKALRMAREALAKAVSAEEARRWGVFGAERVPIGEMRAALAAIDEAQPAQKYNAARIAWELERTAVGDGFYGNALRVAKDIPGLTNDERLLLDRYATGQSCGIDHVALQSLALRIDAGAQHSAEVRSLREENERLRGEYVEWLCARCQTIHPNQRGRTFLQPCPECGDAMEPTSFNIRARRRMDALIDAARMGLEALDACLDALQRIREAGGQSTSAEIAAETAIAALSAALPQQN